MRRSAAFALIRAAQSCSGFAVRSAVQLVCNAHVTRLTETRLQQTKQRQHAAGFSFFGAVRIVKADVQAVHTPESWISFTPSAHIAGQLSMPKIDPCGDRSGASERRSTELSRVAEPIMHDERSDGLRPVTATRPIRPGTLFFERQLSGNVARLV